MFASIGIETIRTPLRSPRANAYAERSRSPSATNASTISRSYHGGISNRYSTTHSATTTKTTPWPCNSPSPSSFRLTLPAEARSHAATSSVASSTSTTAQPQPLAERTSRGLGNAWLCPVDCAPGALRLAEALSNWRDNMADPLSRYTARGHARRPQRAAERRFEAHRVLGEVLRPAKLGPCGRGWNQSRSCPATSRQLFAQPKSTIRQQPEHAADTALLQRRTGQRPQRQPAIVSDVPVRGSITL